MHRFPLACAQWLPAMHANYATGNQLTLLCGGDEYFPPLIAAIDAAEVSVHLETYMFADDACGRAVAAALARAARRGLTVCVLVDGFGSSAFSGTLLAPLTDDRVQVQIFRPEHNFWLLRRHRLRRLHRKLALIDGTRGFVGGINIISDRLPPEDAPRHDYALSIAGPLLRTIADDMRRLWNAVARANRRPGWQLPDTPPGEQAQGHQTAAFVVRDNLRHRHDIEQAYLTAISSARQRILIANAYFLPGRRFRKALLAAAARGVEVSLLLQGRREYPLVHFATQALYTRLLGAGIRVFEYRHSFLHAKVAVIDNDWVTVGSSNIDPFSLLLAREANIVARDPTLARTLREKLEAAIAQGSVELNAGQWKKGSLLTRLLRQACYTLIRVARGLIGVGRRPRPPPTD